ncbi:hypothetical protein AQUCO_00700636v1 [Aquilegia coerulea]|uniref:EF-hand domain-containing protein n=1 Tax=Aquilegia coerulea TaxID=218851 RepID=A0A2G5EL18_AQUCA|nr:hypothetical protein AQUCO_00700636v1 [Aquilegia coerulea]
MVLHHGKPKKEMTVEEFKNWLNQFDADKDGRISKEELHEAVRSLGVWFTSWKTRRGLLAADDNKNGYVDEHEVDHLFAYAQKKLNVKIVT